MKDAVGALAGRAAGLEDEAPGWEDEAAGLPDAAVAAAAVAKTAAKAIAKVAADGAVGRIAILVRSAPATTNMAIRRNLMPQ